MRQDLTAPTGARAAGALVNLTVPVLMLADDLALLAPDAAGVQQLMAALEAACVRWGLVINTSKTELMLVGGVAATACEVCGERRHEASMWLCDGCSRGWHARCMPRPPPAPLSIYNEWLCEACAAGAPRVDPRRPDIEVAGAPLAWVPAFKYLGCQFHQSASLDPELSRRVQLSAAAFQKLLQPFYRQRALRLRTRIRVYRAQVLSVLMYGSEGWALGDARLQRLEVFHRGCLRAIAGVRWADRVSNDELFRRCRCPPISALLQHTQRQWVGHVARMDDSRLTKQAMYSCSMPGGAARGGRRPPQLCERYCDVVARIPRELVRGACATDRRVPTWYDAAQNRALWAKIVVAGVQPSLNEAALQRRRR